ncbi:MAG: hypothetical protein C4541_07320 [Candidatus Auribacter fodinae]|jgi:hypothetical protein|uniref:Uncharacterized protein n=1 Tax=Candidatus Auribacter fodinae TaxID=2093366 RepID=A0A3A4R1I7_9BACT|nr:MAG: hypothetical protein C4541_07320 [Candidatus Auribacter fodinae]
MSVWNSDEHDGSMYSISGNVYGKEDSNCDGLVMYKELALGTLVAFIGWNSAPRKVYRVYVQTDSVGPDFVLLEDDVESKGYETFYMDQGGGPNHILHPNDDPNPRLYRVVVKQ